MKWKCESVECVLHAIPESEYQQIIATLAEILYVHGCQLTNVSPEAPTASPSHPGPSQLSTTDRRAAHG